MHAWLAGGMPVSRIAARTAGSFFRGIGAFGALFCLGLPAHARNVDVADGENNGRPGVGLSRHRAFARGCALNAIAPEPRIMIPINRCRPVFPISLLAVRTPS